MSTRRVRLTRRIACFVAGVAALIASQIGCGTSTGTSFASGIRVDQIGVRDILVVVTPTTAEITWVSRESGRTRVEYGTTEALGSVADGPSGTRHAVTISGLRADTLYYYRVEGRGTIYRFRTLGGARERIAFVSDRADGRREVYIAYEYGENVTRVTTGGGHAPALSRDGTRLCWVAAGEGGLDDIWACTLDAEGVVADTTVNLTQTAARTESHPDWAPDNSAIVFTASEANQPSRIVVRQIADGSETVLVDNGAINDEAVYRPDGERLAFISTARTATVQLAHRPLEEGSVSVLLRRDRTPLAPNEYRVLDAASALLDFSMSSAVDQDVLVTYRSGGVTYTDERQRVPRARVTLYTIGADGTGLRRLVFEDETQGSPSWTPDGSRLVRTVERGGATNLARVDADGGQNVFLTGGGFRDRGPAVSPDGREVLFSSNRHENRLVNLYRVDFNGRIRELNLSSSGDIEPSWSVVPPAAAR